MRSAGACSGLRTKARNTNCPCQGWWRWKERLTTTCVHGTFMDWAALPQLGAKSRGTQDASVLQVSRPGLRGGGGEMPRKLGPPRSPRPALLPPLLQSCAGRRGGDKEVVSQQGTLPRPRPPRLPGPHPPRSACVMVWGLVLREGSLVLQLDCDKGGWKGIPGSTRSVRSAPARTQAARG